MTYLDPNFTIITSGGCNSFCSFCTDPFKRKASSNYLKNLEDVLFNRLPSHFRQVSISGGEPTLSPDLSAILGLLKLSNRFDKIVLTTNGTKLEEKLGLISRGINHLNVSRHAIGYEANTAVFQTKEIIKDEALKVCAAELNRNGIDMNLNHVYTDKDLLNKDYVSQFIEYAKIVGASSVSFRYDQNNNQMGNTYLEKLYADYTIISAGACAVCRNHTILIDGMPVVFKASYAEPSVAISDVYELIYHITGKLSTDWEGNIEFNEVLHDTYLEEYKNQPLKQHVAKAMPVTIPKIVPKTTPLKQTGLAEAVSNNSKLLPTESIVIKDPSYKETVKKKPDVSYGGGGCGGSGAFGGGGCGR